MNSYHRIQPHAVLHLIESLRRFEEAGIDPAFDAAYDDLEREFAEHRLQFRNE